MVYEPSPKKIREECEKIRSRWSERERQRRLADDHNHGYRTPVIRLADLPDQAQSFIASFNQAFELNESGDRYAPGTTEG